MPGRQWGPRDDSLFTLRRSAALGGVNPITLQCRVTCHHGGMHEDADRLLAAREEQLEAELAELTRPVGDLGTISFGKRVGEGTSMAVDRLAAVSAQEHLLTMLEEVRRARARVAEGSYGICEVCGEQIPEGRLEARPWATRCVHHS